METLQSARAKFPPLNKKVIPFLAVPIYGQVCAHFHGCMMELIKSWANRGFGECRHVGDSLVPRARNELTRQFLESGCTDLLFIDSDLIFSPQQVERILAHDADIVGGCYPIKDQGKLRWVFNTHFDSKQPDASGLMDVRYVGTGFLRIRREVFEKMIESGCVNSFEPDHRPGKKEYDFWPSGVYHYTRHSAGVPASAVGKSRYLSEDWYFCQNALDLGYKVQLDGQIILRHVGQAIYPLNSQVEDSGTSNEAIFGASQTGGADSVTTSPVAPAPPLLSGDRAP